MATNQAANQSVSDISAPGKPPARDFEVGEPFNPYKLFTGSFIPEGICQYRSLTPGAKLILGRLFRYAGKDGRVYPSMRTLGVETGICGRQVQRYVHELEQRSFIRCEHEAGKTNHFVFLTHKAYHGETGSPRKRQPPPAKTGIPTTHDINVVQRESSSKRIKKESQKNAAGGRVELGGSGGEEQKQKPFSEKADDEKPKPRTPLQNSEMEFRARITERHGALVDVDVLLKDVRAELDTIPLPEFLAADLKATTAPGRLTNPHGHYRKLARKVGRRKETAALESLTGTMQQGQEFLKRDMPATFKPACRTCNDGKLPGGAYCNCKTGNLRRELDSFMVSPGARPGGAAGGPVIATNGHA
jgi:hypothetical protein